MLTKLKLIVVCGCVTILTGLATDGFAQIEPRIEIEVRQVNGRVDFSFFIRDSILFFIPIRTSIGVSSLFVLRDDRTTVWAIRVIDAEDANAVAHAVTFGVTPRGFSQHGPKAGDSPSLEKHKKYTVWASWGGGAVGWENFVYE